VGVATAKVFAYAVGAGVIGVSALEAIALAAPDDVLQVNTVIDAQRGDVVAQSFQRDSALVWRPQGGSRLLSHAAWIGSLPAGAVVSGPGLEKCIGDLPDYVRALPCDIWHPHAANIARIAYREFMGGRRDDLWGLLPEYSRRAAAEEQWEKKGS
jgi:tRNA threonylcarbamoyladenosine biosynthesis protein TsaB